MMAFSGGDGLPYLRGNQALFSIPGQLIGFANGGAGEVEFMLLCVVIIAGVIYVQYCVVCIGICMHCVMKKNCWGFSQSGIRLVGLFNPDWETGWGGI